MDAAGELFGTETMAELCARQGRLDDALVIYRRLCAQGADEERHERWSARLRALEAQRLGGSAGLHGPSVPASSRASLAPAAAPEPGVNGHALPLVVRQTVRSGQIVYAQGNDLIVLAPVNPGAQLLADGNIHVYAPLRGRAVAGVRGAREARIFCQRLEAELVGIDTATVAAESLPADRFGKPAQISFEAGRCLVAPL
ncbi:MAG TPA: septum site-determining protein MinC [Polyangia bacterium]|jgi:septum site-determining protein MinC